VIHGIKYGLLRIALPRHDRAVGTFQSCVFVSAWQSSSARLREPSPMPFAAWSRLAPQKYRVLLVLLVATLTVQPIASGSVVGKLVHEALVATCILGLLVVFERPRVRWVAMCLALPAIAAGWIGRISPEPMHPAWFVVFHLATVLFLIFALAAILKTLFSQRVVLADHLVGVFCGYLLAGIIWSNLYIVVQELSPGAFHVETRMVWDITDFDSRRSLFNYFSFTTLTTVGFGDVTPIHPVACQLAWLEAAFGQFYVAVLVAQLVGLKLAEPRDA
jgi:hypothetical protein